MISVNRELENYPAIKRKVNELDSKGLFKYVEVKKWFENVENFGTPEGHGWGVKAHKIIGENLSSIILKDYMKDIK